MHPFGVWLRRGEKNEGAGSASMPSKHVTREREVLVFILRHLTLVMLCDPGDKPAIGDTLTVYVLGDTLTFIIVLGICTDRFRVYSPIRRTLTWAKFFRWLFFRWLLLDVSSSS